MMACKADNARYWAAGAIPQLFFAVPDSTEMNGRGRNGKHMSSVENVEIFEDTKRLYETNGKIKEVLARSVKNQKLILEEEELSAVDKARFEDEAKIVVSTKRTFEAAAGYAGQKVAVEGCKVLRWSLTSLFYYSVFL